MVTDKLSIDIAAGTCTYLGTTLRFDNAERACFFYNDNGIGNVRVPIEVDNYELINLNNLFRGTDSTSYLTDEKAYVIDFFRGQCHRYNHIQPYWLSTYDTSATLPTDHKKLWDDDKIKCTGLTKAGAWLNNESMNGNYLYFFGVPLHS